MASESQKAVYRLDMERWPFIQSQLVQTPMDGTHQVIIEPIPKSDDARASAAQRRTIWAWHTQLGKERGDSKERRHDLFKYRHVCPILLRDEVVESFQGLYEMAEQDVKIFRALMSVISHTLLSIKQMREAMDEYDQIWARRGIVFEYRRDYQDAMGK